MMVYKSNFVQLRNEHRIQILRYFTNYPGLFQGKKDMIYFITKVFFELIYITSNTHYVRNVTNEKIVQEKHGDWKFVQFLKGLDGVRFPSLKESWQNPLTQNQNDLLEAFSSILKEFGTRGGGTNRKIMISLLKQKGVNSQFLAEFSGITQRWVNSCKNNTTEEELNGFYKRFSLSKKNKHVFKRRIRNCEKIF